MSQPTQVTQERERALKLYSLLMKEVKIRVLGIEAALSGQIVVTGWMIREFCYLQLRMICELIALGCLVAHGDIKATQAGKLPKAYAADRIFTLLGKLYATFYPTPLRFVSMNPHASGTGRIHNYEPIKTGFLTKAELVSLNHRASDFLHRGTMAKLLSPEPIDEGFPDVLTWVNKIQALLSTHSLSLLDGSLFVCRMSNAEDNEVHVSLMSPAIQ